MLGETSILQVEAGQASSIREVGSSKKSWLVMVGFGFGCFALGVASACLVFPSASQEQAHHVSAVADGDMLFNPPMAVPATRVGGRGQVNKGVQASMAAPRKAPQAMQELRRAPVMQTRLRYSPAQTWTYNSRPVDPSMESHRFPSAVGVVRNSIGNRMQSAKAIASGRSTGFFGSSFYLMGLLGLGSTFGLVGMIHMSMNGMRSNTRCATGCLGCPACSNAATSMQMLNSEGVSRRDFAGLAGAAVLAVPAIANADTEYPNVPFLGGADIVDINNANIRVYTRFPGMYPTVAGILIKNGPYESVDAVEGKLTEKLGESFTPAMKAVWNKYKDKFVALKVAPEYQEDIWNNGLYR